MPGTRRGHAAPTPAKQHHRQAMLRRLVPVLLLALVLCLHSRLPDAAAAARTRVHGSPYSISALPPGKITVVNASCTDELLLLPLVSLSGVLARQQPSLVVAISDADWYWLEDAAAEGYISLDTTHVCDASLVLQALAPAVLGRYVSGGNGSDTTTLVGISAAAALQTVYVTMAGEAKLNALGYSTRAADAARLSFSDLLSPSSIYAKALSRSTAIIQDPAKAPYLVDYSLFAAGLFFFVPKCAQNPEFSAAMQHLDDGGRSSLFGWGDDELDLVRSASSYGVHVHGADWASGLSLWTNLDVPAAAAATAAIDGRSSPCSGKHTVAFVMSDGDNLQWMLNAFVQDPQQRWYGSPFRGRVKMGWTLSPALAEVLPNVFRRIVTHASLNDSFIIAPSGLGYAYPDAFSSPLALDAFAALTDEYIVQYAGAFGDGVVNVIDAGMTPSSVTALLQGSSSAVKGVLYYPYADYSGMKGKIVFVNGKPIVGGRYNLWAGFETPSSLAAKLNKQSTDCQLEDGYSLIPVHAWSMTVESVLQTVQLLDAGRVAVVSPAELVAAVAAHVVRI